MLRRKSIHLLLLITLICNLQSVLAQKVNVSVITQQPYPLYLEHAMEFKYQAIVTLTNLTTERQHIKLLSTLTGDNGVSAEVKESFVPTRPIILEPRETKVLTGIQLKSLNAGISENDINYSGVKREVIMRTERLPEGNYQICLRAYDIRTNEKLSIDGSGCGFMKLMEYDPPVIITPQDQSKVTPLTPQFVNISWTPSGIPGKTMYKLEVVDMTLNNLLNPNDAFDNISIILHLKKDQILQNLYPYTLADPTLTVGHEYALRVVAHDPAGGLVFKNDGKSPVVSFKYAPKGSIVKKGDKAINNKPNVQFGMGGCQMNPGPNDTKAIDGSSTILVGDEIAMGDYTLKLTSVNWSNSKLSGEGKIFGTWLKVPILVSFSDLEVNESNEVVEGLAMARNDDNVPTDWLNDLGNVSFGPEQVEALISSLMGNPSRVFKYPYENMDSVGLGMPLGISRNIGGGEKIIGIVGMIFGPKGAGLNAVADFQLPAYNKHLAFGASGICFGKDGLGGEATLELLQDIKLNENGKFELALKKGEGPENGCVVSFKDDGFEKATIDGDLNFDADAIRNIADKSQVTIPFKVIVEDPKNFMIENINIQAFEFTKFPGFELSAEGIAFDHSELDNPNGLVLPPNYGGGTLWKGLSLDQFSMKLPKKLQENTTIEVSNFIVDENGVGGILDVPNVFNKDKGEMGEKTWKFSMQNLHVELNENKLIGAGFDGEIRIPLTKDNIYLEYSALMSLDDELKYAFKVEVAEEITFPAIIAQASIFPNTVINVEDLGDTFEPSFHLYGMLEFNRSFNGDFQGFPLSFKEVEVKDLIVDKNGVYLGPNGSFSYSWKAEQRKLNGFDINFDTINAKANEVIFGLSIDLLGENNAVGASTELGVKCDWGQDNMLELQGVNLKKISIDGDISVATINGELIIMEDDPDYGDGFQGSVDVDIKLGANSESIGGGGLEIMFGNMPANGKVDAYKYFFFSGEAGIASGIPLSGTLRLYGFKGGMYMNMEKESYLDKAVPVKLSNADTKFGFLAGVDIGLVDKFAFHAKPQMLVQFGTESGFDLLSIYGTAYAFTNWKPSFDPYPPGSSPAYVEMEALMKFKEKIFEFDSEVFVKYPVQGKSLVSATGGIKMHVAGVDDWSLKIGEPNSENIKVELAEFITKQHYFMAGHGLPGMPEVPGMIKSKMKKKYSSSRGQVANASNLSFALGSKYEFSTGELDSWILFANFAAVAGYDAQLSKGNGSCGINSWYLNGQAYAGLDAKIGLKAKIFKKERRFEIASISAAVSAQIAVPNPVYLQAQVSGEATFMGIIKGDFDFDVEYGELCKELGDPSTDALENLKYVQDINPKGGDVHVFTDPEVSLLFSSRENKSYTIDEIDEEGNTTPRTFRFPIKTAKLYIDDANSDLNGKVLASYGDESLDGIWELNNAGDLLTYKSLKSLPAETKMKIEVDIQVQEKIKGNWSSIDANNTKKTQSFVTGENEKVIPPGNVELCYPMNGQKYYLQGDNKQTGYIKLHNSQDDLFAGGMKGGLTKIRFVPVGGGAVIQGSFQGYANNQISFSHPKLVNGQMYVAQLYKDLPPSKLKGNDKPDMQKGGDKIAIGDFGELVTKEFKLLKELKMSDKEHQLMAFLFQTSIYNTIDEKLAKLTRGQAKLTKFNKSASGVSLSFTASQEGFDEADKMQLNPEWLIDQNMFAPPAGDGGKKYYYNHLKKEIYKPYNDTLLAIAYPYLNPVKMPLKMIMNNVEPLFSNTEINNILKQPLNTKQSKKAAPTSKPVTFIVYGCGESQQHFNNFLAKLLNPTTKNIAMMRKINHQDDRLYNMVQREIKQPSSYTYIPKGKYHLLMNRHANMPATYKAADWTL